MRWILLVLIIVPPKTWAQDFLHDIQDLQEKMGENQVDSFLDHPQKEGLPGEFIGSLLPKTTPNSDLLCDQEQEPKKTHYEVVLVAKGNSQLGEFEILPGQKANFRTLDLKFLIESVPTKMTSPEFKSSSILERAREIWNSGYFATPSKDFDPHSSLGQELFIESLVHAGASSSLSESNLSKEMAGILGSVYTTRDERYNALSALSLRLYRNYNNARNPGYDNPKNNPFDYQLPKGDQNLNGLLKAASEFNVFEGGVCNDISEVVAQIGEHLFPDDDVLTVNSGTHFGVLVTDGKETRVIDGGTQFSMSNQLLLDPNLSSTNLRISKVVNGEQREIAVVDTQMGQVMEGSFETGKHLLKTDMDISSVYAHLKKNNFGVSAGVAGLTDSQVVVVVAKYETSGEKWKTFLGTGLSGQTFHSDQESKYQVHFRAGAERNIFSYVNSQTEVNFASGIRLGGMYALNQPKNELGGVGRVDMSLNFDFYNRLNLNYTPLDPNGVRIRSHVEVEQTLGPTNWGNTTGALSYTEASDTGTILKNISFHLNQVNADVSVEKNINSNLTGFANTHYQGSNIGQSVSVLAGLNIRAPAGAQIIVFSGYTDNSLPGYKTQHSLLGAPSGPEIGAKYITKKGTEFSAGMKSTDRGPAYQATIKIPLGKKK